MVWVVGSEVVWLFAGYLRWVLFIDLGFEFCVWFLRKHKKIWVEFCVWGLKIWV